MKSKPHSLAIMLLTSLALFSCCEITAFAQATDDDYPRAEFYAGYSHLRRTSGTSTGFNGFNASITGNVTKYIGLKGELSGHYNSTVGTSFSIYNFLGGLQVKNNSRSARLKPFAHALVGGARYKASTLGFGSFSETGFAMALGGGLDVRAGKHIDVRVIQADYNPARISGGTDHNFRLGVGIVIH